MSTAFALRPGTVAYRAVAHLETLPEGSEIMTSALAEAIGVPPNGLLPCLVAAHKHGHIHRRQRDQHARSPHWWSLTDYSARPRAPVAKVLLPEHANGEERERKAPLSAMQARDAAVAAPASDGAVAEFPSGIGGHDEARGESAQPRGKEPAPTTPSDGGGLRVALWSDGVLEIRRADGSILEFGRDETRGLLAYLRDPADAATQD